MATRPVTSMEPVAGGARECWAVAAGNCHTDNERMVAAGYDNGDVKVGRESWRAFYSVPIYNLSIGLGPKSRQALVGNPGTRNVRKSLDKKFSAI